MPELLKSNTVVCKDVDLIMLDKDGTIIDIHHYWASMIRLRAIKVVDFFWPESEIPKQLQDGLCDAMGIDLDSGRMKSEGPVGVKPRSFIVDTVVAFVIQKGSNTDHEEINGIFKEVDQETSTNMLPLVKLLPGIPEFLETAKSRGVRLAVVSTDVTPRAEAAMTALGIQHYFSQIIGGDQVKTQKPAADLAELTLSLTQADKKRCVVIGDHPVDIEMGLNTGIECNIGVCTGLANAERFHPLECHVVNTIEELTLN